MRKYSAIILRRFFFSFFAIVVRSLDVLGQMLRAACCKAPRNEGGGGGREGLYPVFRARKVARAVYGKAEEAKEVGREEGQSKRSATVLHPPPFSSTPASQIP